MSQCQAVIDVDPFEAPADLGLTTTLPRPAGRAYPTCERDILAVMGEGLQRMTTRKIQTALRRQGRNRSISSLKRALANLVARGILRSSRRKPFGYLRASELPAEPVPVTHVDIPDVLREIGFRMTRRVLVAALWERGAEWGETKLAEELDRLLLAGVIDFDPDVRPAGYGLPEWM
jgi:hypothetical protein